MADGWTIGLERLEVLNADEDDVWSDGDEPYFVTIGFRSRFRTPNSTSVFWSRHLDDDWANGIDAGGTKAIPPAMGVVSFEGVDRPDAAALQAGERPEVVGALVVAMESDATPFGVIRDKMDEVRDEIRSQLVRLIEQGNLDPANPRAAIQNAIAEIRNRMTPSVGEAISIFLQSFGDPDQVIGIRVLVFGAVDPSLADAVQLPVLSEQDLTQDFSTSGVHYRVTGRVRMRPRRMPQGAFVGATVRNADHLDVFATDDAGIIRTTAWEPAFTDGWRGWWEIAGGRAAPGAPVHAVSRSRNKLDAFVIGMDNRVYTAAWEPAFADGWHGWWDVLGGVAAPGAPVTVVSRSADKLDAFVTDVNGNTMAAAWEPAFTDGWHGWWHIQGGKAEPGAPVTAVSRSTDKVDVFVVGTDGRVWTAAWEPASPVGWRGWWSLGA